MTSETPEKRPWWVTGIWVVLAIGAWAIAGDWRGGVEEAPPSSTVAVAVQATSPQFARVEQALINVAREWSVTEPQIHRTTLVDGLSDEEVVRLGWAACWTLFNGGTGTSLVEEILSTVPPALQTDAVVLAGLSVEVLCPEHAWLLDY